MPELRFYPGGNGTGVVADYRPTASLPDVVQARPGQAQRGGSLPRFSRLVSAAPLAKLVEADPASAHGTRSVIEQVRSQVKQILRPAVGRASRDLL